MAGFSKTVAAYLGSEDNAASLATPESACPKKYMLPAASFNMVACIVFATGRADSPELEKAIPRSVPRGGKHAEAALAKLKFVAGRMFDIWLMQGMYPFVIQELRDLKADPILRAEYIAVRKLKDAVKLRAWYYRRLTLAKILDLSYPFSSGVNFAAIWHEEARPDGNGALRTEIREWHRALLVNTWASIYENVVFTVPGEDAPRRDWDAVVADVGRLRDELGGHIKFDLGQLPTAPQFESFNLSTG